MIATLLLTLICLDVPPHDPPYTVQQYSVRQDGAGHACDCTLAPCGQRGGATCCDETSCFPCPLLVEPGCFLGTPDECGNVGACAYLDIHAFPSAIVWRFDGLSDDGCIETDAQEDRVGWGTWWRLL